MSKFTLNAALVQNFLEDRWRWIRSCIGTQDRNVDAECGYPNDIDVATYKRAYERGDIAARIVEIYPQETWQENPEVYETEENIETDFEKEWTLQNKIHNFFPLLQRVDTLSGIGSFAVILIGINDGKKLNEPVEGINPKGEREGEPKKREILYLRTFDESSVTVKSLESDITSPRLGLPKMYSIRFQDTKLSNSGVVSQIDKEVHWTRIIHICDNRVDSDVYGQPRLKRVFDRILDLKKVRGGSGEMFWRGGFPGLSIETQQPSGDEVLEFDPDKTKKQIEDYQRGLKRYLALVGMTAKSLSPNIADPTHHMNAQIRVIAIAIAVPWRILMGAELGQLASEQDITAWNKRVARRQADYVAPYIIRPFVKRLQDMGVLPATKEESQILIHWKDTHTVTETDKATVAEKITNSITKFVQGDGDMAMDLFHFYTLVLNYTDKEANAIIEKVQGKLEADRELKDEMAELAIKEGEAGIKAMKSNGGAGNGNANGNKTPARKPSAAPRA